MLTDFVFREIEEIHTYLKKDLSRVENEIKANLASDFRLLSETIDNLLKAGGKRLRPIFILIASRFGTKNKDSIKLAAALEMIHMATLIHDDVIDQSALRRGTPTVKKIFDNKAAIYIGDFILSRAINLLCEFDSSEVSSILSKSMILMCEGEMQQAQNIFNLDQHIKTYLKCIRLKTALLTTLSCKLACIINECSDDISISLHKFGYYIGMAFQLTDDLLDIMGKQTEIGKPKGNDLKQGNITLPILYTYKVMDKKNKDIIVEYMKYSSSNVNEIIVIIKKYGGIEYTLDLANRFIEKAKKAIQKLPNMNEKEYLFTICDFIIGRKF